MYPSLVKMAEALNKNPLCGAPLQLVGKLVAIIQMALSGICILASIVLYCRPTDKDLILSSSSESAKNRDDTILAVVMTLLSISIPMIILHVFLLFHGIKMKTYKTVTCCWIILSRVVLQMLSLVVFLIATGLGLFPLGSIGCFVVFFLYVMHFFLGWYNFVEVDCFAVFDLELDACNNVEEEITACVVVTTTPPS